MLEQAEGTGEGKEPVKHFSAPLEVPTQSLASSPLVYVLCMLPLAESKRGKLTELGDDGSGDSEAEEGERDDMLG